MAAASTRRKREADIGIPDFLGITARIQTVATLLEEGQTSLQFDEQLRIGNGHRPSDVHPHFANKMENPPTYAERARAIREGIHALVEANADIREELTAEAVKRRRARERYHEQDDGLSRYANTPSP